MLVLQICKIVMVCIKKIQKEMVVGWGELLLLLPAVPGIGRPLYTSAGRRKKKTKGYPQIYPDHIA